MASQPPPPTGTENGTNPDNGPVTGVPEGLPGTEHTRPQQRTIEVDTDPKAVLPQYWNPPGMAIERELFPIDITDKGELVLRRKPPVHDTVAEVINRIWMEVPGGFENLKASKEAIEKVLVKAESPASSTKELGEKELSEDSEVEDEFSEKKFQEMRITLCNRLWEAQNEAANALGLMNGLISNQLINPSLDPNFNSQKPDEDPLKAPIPPEMLHFTFANPPKNSVKRRIRETKLMVASKRHQLTNSAALLTQRTSRVREANIFEKTFFSRLFQLRTLNWIIQSPTPPLSYKGPRAFVINYGFSDAGSTYFQRAYAQIKRNEDIVGGILVEPHPEHQARKVVFLQLVEKDVEAEEGEGDFGKTVETPVAHSILESFLLPLEPVPSEQTFDSETLKVHHQLQRAQNTVLETELFFQLTQEARALDGILNLEDDSFSFKIDDRRQLKVRLETLDEPSPDSSASAEPVSVTELDGDVKFCRDLKLMLLSKLRILHQHRLKQRRKRFIQHIPVPSAVREEIMAPSPDLSILRVGIDVIRYHFFRQLIWDVTKKVIGSLSSSILAGATIQTEMIPLPGMFVGMFHTAHLLHITINNGHSLHFKLASPRRIHALLPQAVLSLDRETDIFPDILEKQLVERLMLCKS